MYQDTKRLRTKKSVYLDEYEDAVITAHANLQGISKAALMREMIMRQARELVGLGDLHEKSMGDRAG
ncbi:MULTISPECIES: ribbon-helix-helix protein, CopG family [Halomonadaceae]|uniref:Ribbon-helix-helix protein CopG domain-containing protein n=2 Tax=Vreelandella TaxID=3137766 RepID=A0ABX2B7Z9_9GAMM|nr:MULTISPECIES: ribbon-helix-helix protein, CopG family [Halomonas]AZM95127.1 ribbon-helix-helix protein, CopG family [Halomonas venusta]MDN3562132.1 ribbon-helix-helix protein, CopG family [Halomonas neptunia]MDQ7734665.1 ribbon-helix-helix protein, CopG family [Halomonas sp. SpR1]NPT29638.1 hypothetical protein [Halomonas venusta]WQH11834.1 ribbon-helix-helix protein, CopG family [Halomonas neptunia]